jgi:hypothetical protein
VFQRSAHLSDEEARALDQIAENCIQKVTELDKRAREIIAGHRPENRSRNGAPEDPPQPAELSQLQQDRNNVILQAIEQIRIAFGDTAFKRLDEYVKNHGDGKRFVLPTANKKPLPIQVTVTILDRDGSASRKQFAANEEVIIQVAMLNNSTQMIAVKESEVVGWLQLISTQNRELPLSLLSRSGKESAVDVPPTQLTIVGRIELGPNSLKLKPGEYHILLSNNVLLNRPPNDSELLQLSFSGSAQVIFEIVP